MQYPVPWFMVGRRAVTEWRRLASALFFSLYNSGTALERSLFPD